MIVERRSVEHSLRLPSVPSRGGVLVLGGSEGGHHHADASTLADAGFTALSLAYFGTPGTGPHLHRVPLERLRAGLDLLGDAGAGPLGIVGGSRGGEAALLLASVDPRVRAVVAVAGSGIVTPGIDRGAGSLTDIITAGTAAWTYDGTDIPTALHALPRERVDEVTAAPTVRLRDTFEPVRPEHVDLAIPVEQSDAAVLLVSARDDGIWDSASLSQLTIDRLERSRHHRRREHVQLDAGHDIAGPPRPESPTSVPGPGVLLQLGGTPSANALARSEAWEATLAWLGQELTP